MKKVMPVDNPLSDVAADFVASDHAPSPLAVRSLLPMVSVVSVMQILSSILSPIPPSIPEHIYSRLSALFMDLDTPIPSFISDSHFLMFLASKCVDQTETPVVFGPVRPLVPYSDDEDDDVAVLDGPVALPTPRKQRSHKLKEPLDERFLRRSKRRHPSH